MKFVRRKHCVAVYVRLTTNNLAAWPTKNIGSYQNVGKNLTLLIRSKSIFMHLKLLNFRSNAQLESES